MNLYTCEMIYEMTVIAISNGFVGTRRTAKLMREIASVATPNLHICFIVCTIQIDTFYTVFRHHQETNPNIRDKPVDIDFDRCRLMSSSHQPVKLDNVPRNVDRMFIADVTFSSLNSMHSMWNLVTVNRSTLRDLYIFYREDVHRSKVDYFLDKCLQTSRLEHFTFDCVTKDEIDFQSWLPKFVRKNMYLQTCGIYETQTSFIPGSLHPDVRLRNIVMLTSPDFSELDGNWSDTRCTHIRMPRPLKCQRVRGLQTIQWVRFVLGMLQWTRQLKHRHERAMFDILVGSIFPMVVDIAPPEFVKLPHIAQVRKLSSLWESYVN